MRLERCACVRRVSSSVRLPSSLAIPLWILAWVLGAARAEYFKLLFAFLWSCLTSHSRVIQRRSSFSDWVLVFYALLRPRSGRSEF